MRKWSLSFLGVLIAGVVSAAREAGCSKPEATSAPAVVSNVEHGKYLVERVAMCSDCHSPRNEKGEFVKERWLMGGPLFFKPAVAMPEWADLAPSIAGLFNYSEEKAVQLMETGERKAGPLRPPMPEFRFYHQDAMDAVAYLKSLGQKQ